MKKQNLINLIKYHMEKNDTAFVSEASEIAKEFDASGNHELAMYIMELISTTNMYIPQSCFNNLRFLRKTDYSNKPLLLPNIIEEDIVGITRAISMGSDISKFLFYGAPGTGKTESAHQIARLLGRDVLTVNFEELIDSKLGETAKNVALLFDEINHLQYSNVVIVLDEIDALVLNRSVENDLREMARVTSTFIRELDTLNQRVTVIATTNMINDFDKAIIRRFDAVVSFDRYSKDDLIEVADALLIENLKKTHTSRQNMRLFNKILNNLETIPYPGDLKQIIKTSIAFSDPTYEYDYLRKIYLAFNGNPQELNINKLSADGFTTREIEILSRVPKSSVARRLSGENKDE